jgi:long-chain fatty acid transport protein
MKSKFRNVAASLVALLLFAVSGTAFATNGYFTHGVGAESKGMAGTGIGSNAETGAIIVASNPALGVFSADSWEAGLSFFSPRRSYSTTQSLSQGQGGAFSLSQGSYDSSSEWFPIPYVAKSWKLADDRALSFLFYGRGGMNTDWEDPNQSASFDPDGPGPAPPGTFPGTFGAGNSGVDLMQAFMTVNYAGKVSDQFSWGIGPVIAIQSFEARGLGSFAGFTKTFAASGGTAFPTALTDNGHDLSYGWGISAGLWWGLSDAIGVGLSYQSKMSMSELDDYADLFAEAGGFDIPSSLKFGLSFKASDVLRLNFDIEHTAFGEIDSVGNSMLNLFNCPTANPLGTDIESCLGGANGAGFGWDDMTTYKIGAEWHSSDDYTWRFGYSYGEQPVQAQDAVFNILAPGVMEQHFTVGLTKHRSNGGELTFSVMYAPENSVTGPNPFDHPTQPQMVELKMSQFEFEVAYRW